MNHFEAHADCESQHEAELAEACPVFGWNGRNDWKILPGSAMRRKDLAPGGFQLNADLRFTCLVAQFGLSATDQSDKMLQNGAVTYLGDLYKVEAVFIAPGGLQMHVECNSLNQSA